MNISEYSVPQENTPEEIMMLEHFNTVTTSEFLANVLFYIGGFIVSKLVRDIECQSCKSCFLSCFSQPSTDHDYCGMKCSEVQLLLLHCSSTTAAWGSHHSRSTRLLSLLKKYSKHNERGEIEAENDYGCMSTFCDGFKECVSRSPGRSELKCVWGWLPHTIDQTHSRQILYITAIYLQ